MDIRCAYTIPSGERCWLREDNHGVMAEGFPVHSWVPGRSFLEVVWEKTHPDAVIPAYAHEGDAGFDLVCVEGASLLPGDSARLAVGLRAALPPGHWIWITSRSSTWDRGLMVIDGKIDAGYRGEWFARVVNWSDHAVTVEPGDRLVQGVIMKVHEARMYEGPVIVEATTRGAGGFGSTGHRSAVTNGA